MESQCRTGWDAAGSLGGKKEEGGSGMAQEEGPCGMGAQARWGPERRGTPPQKGTLAARSGPHHGAVSPGGGCSTPLTIPPPTRLSGHPHTHHEALCNSF
eukprot:3813458-Rhodomonas_salina.6